MATASTDFKGLDEIRSDMSSLRDDLTQALRQLTNDDEGTTGRVREAAAALRDKSKDLGKRAIDSTETQIKERPFLSILVVFLIGLVLGKVLDQRLRG